MEAAARAMEAEVKARAAVERAMEVEEKARAAAAKVGTAHRRR